MGCQWKDSYLNRMRENGKGLFGLLGIERQDKGKEKKILVAISIGYPDEQAVIVINQFRNNRETLEKVVHWVNLT